MQKSNDISTTICTTGLLVCILFLTPCYIYKNTFCIKSNFWYSSLAVFAMKPNFAVKLTICWQILILNDPYEDRASTKTKQKLTRQTKLQPMFSQYYDAYFCCLTNNWNIKRTIYTITICIDRTVMEWRRRLQQKLVASYCQCHRMHKDPVLCGLVEFFFSSLSLPPFLLLLLHLAEVFQHLVMVAVQVHLEKHNQFFIMKKTPLITRPPVICHWQSQVATYHCS